MNFSLRYSKSLIPDDLRSAFGDLVEQERAAQDPARAVKDLFNDEPEQLSFNFMFPKERLS